MCMILGFRRVLRLQHVRHHSKITPGRHLRITRCVTSRPNVRSNDHFSQGNGGPRDSVPINISRAVCVLDTKSRLVIRRSNRTVSSQDVIAHYSVHVFRIT